MSALKIRNRTLTLAMAAVATAVAVSGARRTAADPATGPTGRSPLDELTRVRESEVDTLRRGVDLATQLYTRGLVPSYADVGRLSRELVDTRLRLAASPAERAAVLREGLTAAQGQEALTTSRFKAGLCSDLDVAEAQVYRLRIEEQTIEAGFR